MTRLLFRYVRADFLPIMAVTGGLLVFLGVWSLLDARPGHAHHHTDHGHDHARLPRVGVLLVVPMLLFGLCSPPSLGAFSADQSVAAAAARQPARQVFPHLSPTHTTDLDLEHFTLMFLGSAGTLDGRPVRLLGFASTMPGHPDQPTLNRLKIFCCAADALPFLVRLQGAPTLARDDWYEVEGHLDAAASGDQLPVFVVTSVRAVPPPKNPYL